MAEYHTIYDEAGQVLGVRRGDQPPDEAEVAAFRELSIAVGQHIATEDPDPRLGRGRREGIARLRRKAGLDDHKETT